MTYGSWPCLHWGIDFTPSSTEPEHQTRGKPQAPTSWGGVIRGTPMAPHDSKMGTDGQAKMRILLAIILAIRDQHLKPVFKSRFSLLPFFSLEQIYIKQLPTWQPISRTGRWLLDDSGCYCLLEPTLRIAVKHWNISKTNKHASIILYMHSDGSDWSFSFRNPGLVAFAWLWYRKPTWWTPAAFHFPSDSRMLLRWNPLHRRPICHRCSAPSLEGRRHRRPKLQTWRSWRLETVEIALVAIIPKQGSYKQKTHENETHLKPLDVADPKYESYLVWWHRPAAILMNSVSQEAKQAKSQPNPQNHDPNTRARGTRSPTIGKLHPLQEP